MSACIRLKAAVYSPTTALVVNIFKSIVFILKDIKAKILVMAKGYALLIKYFQKLKSNWKCIKP